MNDRFIGTAVAKKATVKLLDDGNYSLENKDINIKTGIEINNAKEYQKLGTYTIPKPDTEEVSGNTSFTGYDYMKKFDTQYVDSNTYPIRLDTCLENLCSQVGLTLGNKNFPNNSYMLKGNPFTNKETRKTVLSNLVQLAGGFAEIDVEDGKLYVRNLDVSGEAVETIDGNNYDEFKPNNVFGPVNSVRIQMNSGVDGEETIKEAEGVTDENRCQITIADNYYLTSAEEREAVINGIFNALNGLTYLPIELSYYGYPWLKLGDKIKVKDKNDKEYITYVMEHTLKYNGAYSGIIKAIALTKTQQAYKEVLSLKDWRRNTELAVDKINGKMTAVIEEQSEQSEKLTKVEQDVNGITSKVSSVEQSVENITKIEGTAEGKNIYIDDASAEPLIDIMLEGESQQATRTGKNSLDNTATTKISNGITFTVNSDKTVLADGTNDTSANSSLVINRYDLSPGTYILNGCPSGGASNTYRLAIQETGSYSILGSIDIGNGSGEFTIDTTTNVQIAIFIQKGLTVNNLLFKPMLRKATIADDTYEQYGASPSPDYLSKIENLEGKNKVKEINWKQMPSISTGATVTNVNGYGTDYIDVDNTKQYIFSYLGTSGSKYIVYYDKDKNFLGYDTEIQINNFAKWNETGYVRLRIDCPQGSVTAFQLEEGTVATGYVPYNSLEIKDVGKNLYAGNEITINGTYSSNTSVNLGSRYLSEGTYTISLTNSLPNNSYIYLDANGSIATAIRNKATFTLTEEQNVPMRLVVKAGTYSNFTTKIMIEKGMVVTDYEPHQQQTEYFPLSEGQKLYKNSYLVDDGIHHSRKQVVLDGTETGWYTLANQTGTNTSYFCIPKSDMKKASTLICDKFINRNVWNTDEEGIQSIIDNLIRLRINTSRASTVAELKTWLSNNPIRVEYELAEEEIVPYTEDQKEAWEKLRHFTLFRGINNITSTANAKITYVRDNGLSDTYETKRNIRENYYTKSETDSQISQTADSIKESVKEINEQTQEKLATLELANQSLEFATKRTGGNNLVRNSAMINDNNFWLAHAKYPYQESDTPPDSPTEGAYWYCTANSGSYMENQMYVYNSGWQVSELSRKSLLSAQNYFAYTTSNEYWANGKNANENTLSGRVIKLDGRQDYTVSHIFNITEPITLNQNENELAISYFIKNSIVQGNVCVGLMFLNEADFTEVEKPYSLYEPGIILTPDDLKDLTKIEQIIEIPKKSDFIPVVVSNTAPTDTSKNWLDTTIYLPKKYNSQTSQWEILDTKMSLYNESSREVWTYRYFYGFYYQTPIIYDTAEIKSCYVALTFYPAFAVYTGNVEPTPYKGLYWNNKTTNLVKRAKYNDTTFVEWETLDIPSSLLPTGASLGVELFDYIVPIKGFVEIADLKLEYNTMCTQWTQFPGEVYGKNYKMDEKGFWIQANQNTMFIDEDEILATYKGINIFQINKDLAYFYKIQATESIEIGNYFLKTQQINSKNMLLLY